MNPYRQEKPDYYLYKGKGSGLVPSWGLSNPQSSGKSNDGPRQNKDRIRSDKDRGRPRRERRFDKRKKEDGHEGDRRRKKGKELVCFFHMSYIEAIIILRKFCVASTH